MLFVDRAAAGDRLADEVRRLELRDPVVLGLPRGGVPVAARVARALGAPLDVIVVRKLGVPVHPELGFGAIGEGGVRILNDGVVRMARLGRAQQASVEEAERSVLERRLRQYRGHRERVPVEGRTVVVVDDGVATGSTAAAACRVARAQGAARVVLAVPLAPAETLAWLRQEADEVVCLSCPDDFGAVGRWYQDFSQTSDEEVGALLAEHMDLAPDPVPASGEEPAEDADPEVVVRAAGAALTGDLTLPHDAPAIVAFAHGSGSSRHSPRNRSVAEALQQAGLGTLLFDLLTPGEGDDRDRVFDIPLLAARLTGATGWLRAEYGLPVALFGASTGAAAALTTAAEPDADIAAVVSRGGRPDLAASRLADVRAPTLLIVGGRDTRVLELNLEAAALMRCEHRVEVVPGATHLFEEPGALKTVSSLAADWFITHLSARP
ncbi:phosphoribosyltransferase family protein [Streptomyces sp. NPDC002889]|uniref:phosphoribosyltransferase family protein n=1 Tax=Streptomyces sp. NPDC002889 TaxID=3364669 RepID=UPI0036B231AA